MFRKTPEDIGGIEKSPVNKAADAQLNAAVGEEMLDEIDAKGDREEKSEEPAEQKGQETKEELVAEYGEEIIEKGTIEVESNDIQARGDRSETDEDVLDGRVIDVNDDKQDIIIPDGPSKLDGEVLLVRRTDAAEQARDAGLKVKRVKADNVDEEESHGFLYSFLDTLRFISLGLLVGILLVVFVVQRNDVYGESMEPTLFDNDAVFVEMISVYLGNFERGDIVTIDAEGMEGYYHKENLIKRIIGRPGETVDIVDGMIYINGNLLIEPYLTEGVMTYVSSEGTAKGYDHITLGPNEYYCLGDNRGASNDSRRLGPFQTKQLKSHVIARIFPFDAIELF